MGATKGPLDAPFGCAEPELGHEGDDDAPFVMIADISHCHIDRGNVI